MEREILEVPFIYIASVIPRGKRNPIKLRVEAVMPVALTVAAAGELAPAVTVLPASRFNHRGAREWFWDGHGFLMGSPNDRVFGLGEFRSALLDPVKSPFKGTQHPFFDLAEDRLAPVFKEGHGYDGRWVSDDRQARADKVAAKFADRVLFEGRLLQRSSEPVLTVSLGGNHSYINVTTIDDPARSTLPIYRIDRMHAAVAHASEESFGDFLDEPEPQIHLHGIYKVDDQNLNLVADARTVMLSIKSIDLLDMPTDVVTAWLCLRDALNADCGPEAVAMVLANLGYRLKDSGLRHGGGAKCDSITRTLHRWYASNVPKPALAGP